MGELKNRQDVDLLGSTLLHDATAVGRDDKDHLFDMQTHVVGLSITGSKRDAQFIATVYPGDVN
jgi:hypothetical protein